ncbi:MAG: anti-sigma factor [Burkholderiales bacterium]|nr:anti-sigma factor [Burkholderiales bacterium]
MQRPDESTLSAWLDGELDDTTRQAVAAWLQAHPEEAARVRLWAADRDALRARFDPVLDEPLPEALRRTVQEGGRRRGPAALAAAPRHPLALAAAVAGLLLTGALVGALLARQFPSPRELASASRGNWPQRAAVAHAVYVPEVRHPVEVNVAEGTPEVQQAQEEHLARWLTKRLDMPVRLFDLRSEGFALVGGRLLPDAQGPSAQLMYQNSGGQRVTVYLRKPESGTQTAFRYQQEGELGMFYWAEEGYGCALVGKLPRERLLALAEAAYKQVEASITPPPVTKPSS